MTDPRRIQRTLARLRVVIYAALALLVGYFFWRYDLARLPEEGLSPLVDVQPGDRLVIDRHPGTLHTGDAILFRGAEGELLLGRVAPPPAFAPAAVREACAHGALWVVKERPDSPGPDSSVLGPIPPDRVAGRVAAALPW